MNNKYPKILIVKGKYGDDPVLINSEDGLHKFALDILSSRLEGYWYNDDLELKEKAFDAIKTSNGILAWKILKNRAFLGYEYEDIEEYKNFLSY